MHQCLFSSECFANAPLCSRVCTGFCLGPRVSEISGVMLYIAVLLNVESVVKKGKLKLKKPDLAEKGRQHYLKLLYRYLR